MRKITRSDADAVVQILRKWKGRALTWEALRSAISASLQSGEQVWSRQSLQANEAIQIAWKTKKEALRNRTRKERGREENESSMVEVLQLQLAELQTKYDNLALRHRRLLHNASMLPGGVHLLVDPLPDNTRAQSSSRH